MTSIFLQGFFMGASLIIAIGVQNAFVLRQGIKQRHVFATAITAFTFDAILIAAGVLGFGVLVEQFPSLITYVTWGGAAFLIAYGFKSFYSALKPRSLDQNDAKGLAGDGSLKKTIAVLLAVSILNPHVYLDTVVLLGGISASHGETGRYIFGFGAVLASFAWFFSLAYGARLLVPLFEKPRSWQVLDVLIGLIMWLIAFKLITTI
ncbi:MAG: LysE/ArgO family amino acid transporter [Pseudomonadota bacterium]